MIVSTTLIIAGRNQPQDIKRRSTCRQYRNVLISISFSDYPKERTFILCIDRVIMTGPANGWLRGVIKEVPSGDTVVITGPVKSGIPPEKRLTLSSLLAPKLVGALEYFFISLFRYSSLERNLLVLACMFRPGCADTIKSDTVLTRRLCHSWGVSGI